MSKQHDNEFVQEQLPKWIVGICLAIILFLIPFPMNTIESNPIKFESKTENNSLRELGDNYVSQVGVNGEEEINYSTTGSLFQRIFASLQVEKVFLDKKTTVEPVAEVTSVGTLKYQYMYCSNHTAQYYTDEHFAHPNTGFTSKSADACSATGNGVKVNLSNTPPNSSPTCIDVTSYDYNWNNDMLCTRPDGSRYYTSYAGAGY